MSRIPRQPGDARLSRDGTVKLDGKFVGRWWREENDLYCFAVGDEPYPACHCLMRHELMSAVREVMEYRKVAP